MGYNKLKGKNNTYAFSFFGMEILNFFNVCFQMILTNIFLGGKFFDYGTRVFEYVENVEVGGADWNWHPMDEVFPKMSKCQFNKHGVGGGIQVCAWVLSSIKYHPFSVDRTTTLCACCH